MDLTPRFTLGSLPGVSHRRAITLVELLVVISIVLVLIAIFLPGLAGVRARAMRTDCIARIQSSAQAIAAYSIDWDGKVPGVPVIRDGSGPMPGFLGGTLEFPNETPGNVVYIRYFDQSYYFNILMELGGVGYERDYICPSQPDDILGFGLYADHTRSGYTLPESFAADPKVFGGGLTTDIQLARTQALAGVRFPAQKVLLYERMLYHERNRWLFSEAASHGVPVPMVGVDGHGGAIRVPNPPAKVLNGLESRSVSVPHATPDGIRGLDPWSVN